MKGVPTKILDRVTLILFLKYKIMLFTIQINLRRSIKIKDEIRSCCAIAFQFSQSMITFFGATNIPKIELFYWKRCLVSE